MKILFHTQEFLPTECPCTKRIKGLANHLVTLGHEVDVVCAFQDKKKWKNLFKIFGKKKNDNINTYYYYSFPLINKSNIIRFLNHITFAFSSLFHLLRFRRKYDFVITTSPPLLISKSAYYIAKAKNAKIIFDIRDIWPDIAIEMDSFSKKSIYYKLFSSYANFMYKKADLITAVTKLKVKNLIERHNIDENKVKHISNGFDLEFLDNEIDMDIVNKYDLDNKFTVIYIGNLGYAQGLETLINLANKHQDNQSIQFLIIGSGVEQNRLMNLVKEKSLSNVKFLGRISHNKILTFLSYSKMAYVALVNSNLKDSVPTKLLEALGVGIPVLLAANGESCDILKESKCGEFAKPEDFEQILENFNKIYKNYSDYKNNSQYSKIYIKENYSRKKIAGKLEKELYDIK